ncbi:mannose-6-phosphate isomerase, class I [Kocuria turfanensis]|uniref:mannose-6-phosphate isomerase n=1 Tax=Kocuria turfanensis TaxID=388357 RepID=A0A512IBY1_9MICC|nr:mannose-6-phosphate isomerase, class I [Kocuria turfanensis]GEO95203.1 putative mannose-6-phosphate isomerase ManA [Kocuria turfanensis]
MGEILRMRNPVQHYAWGSREVLARLRGEPVPSPEPEAELWVGAHPSAPSTVLLDGGERPLDRLVREDPEGFLPASARGGELPYLLKILAIDAPLSIQVHPSPEQAEEGYEREQRAGIPRDDPRRNYKDRSAKPETVVALTDVELLTGVQPAERLRATADRLGLDWLRAAADGRRPVLPRVLTLDDAAAADAVAATVAAARAAGPQDPVAALVRYVHDRHPDDRGLLVAVCMQHVHLAPGQALHTPAGQVHAYLCGTAVEVMSSSDNVLRAGLTGKHVDVPELLAVLAEVQSDPEVVEPAADEHGARVYPLWDERLALVAHELVPGRSVPFDLRGTAVLLAVGDRAVVRAPEAEWTLGGGESLLHRGAPTAVELSGDARVFTVSCG